MLVPPESSSAVLVIRGVLGGYTRVYAVYQPLVFFDSVSRLTSFVIIKQGIRGYAP